MTKATDLRAKSDDQLGEELGNLSTVVIAVDATNLSLHVGPLGFEESSLVGEVNDGVLDVLGPLSELVDRVLDRSCLLEVVLSDG